MTIRIYVPDSLTLHSKRLRLICTWFCALAYGVIGQTIAEVPDTNRYNVLLVAVDDLRPELRCFGVEHAQSPHLDRFAARSLRFARHYVAVPTCGSSRFAMLTGRSPGSTGITAGNDAFYSEVTGLDSRVLPGAQSMPELFRRSGYTTCMLGKISHTADGRVFAYDGSGDGRPEMPHAWDEALTPMGDWKRGWGVFFAYANGRHREDGNDYKPLWEFTAQNDDELPDGMIATQAIERLEKFKADGERFFMGVGFIKPHLPFVATQSDWEAFAGQDIPLPPPGKIASPHFSNSGEFYKYDAEHEKTHPLSEDAIRNSRRAYLACVRYVDRQIGRLVTALEDLELTKNTVIVVWGDHGWHLGEQQIWAKHTPFERATRSVLMIAMPGQRTAGRESLSLTEAIDIYPTLVELCNPTFRNAQFPLDGRSLVPILRHQRARVRETAVSYWRQAVSVRDERYRLVSAKSANGVRENELYDLESSFDSIENIAQLHPEICERLMKAAGL